MSEEGAPQPGGQDPTSADGGVREHPEYGRELWPGVYQNESVRTIPLSAHRDVYEINKFTNVVVEGENGVTYEVSQGRHGYSSHPDAVEIQGAISDFTVQELHHPPGVARAMRLETASGAKEVWDFIRLNPGKNSAELGRLIREYGEAAHEAAEKRAAIRKRHGAQVD